MDNNQVELSVSEFVTVFNHSLEYIFPSLTIYGELANLRISKNRWLYFDLKDEESTVKFFGTVYHLPGPLEDGMMLRVRGAPRLHNQYGFSVNVQSIKPAGEGSIKKAAQLLQIQLAKEGLFDESRKRQLPYPPERIGLITSKQSAAYADFVKVLAGRWGGVRIELLDVQVQGDLASPQIVAGLEQFNSEASPPDVLVLIRGGGSPEDLAAFNTESVTRAVAASRVPTLVAIGHETDLSLAELAADRRASTPSNAAELLVPEKTQALAKLRDNNERMTRAYQSMLNLAARDAKDVGQKLASSVANVLSQFKQKLASDRQLLSAYNPSSILDRGYAIVRKDGVLVRDARKLKSGDIVETQLANGAYSSAVKAVRGR